MKCPNQHSFVRAECLCVLEKEVQILDVGLELSPVVAAQVDVLAGEIIQQLERWAAG
jgi:Ni,Fe-hydrogenase maturation factor